MLRRGYDSSTAYFSSYSFLEWYNYHGYSFVFYSDKIKIESLLLLNLRGVFN